LLIKARNFGNSPECNGNAIVVIFRPFPLLRAGQIVGWIGSCIAIIFYTWVTVKDLTPKPLKKKFKATQMKKVLIPQVKPSLLTEKIKKAERTSADPVEDFAPMYSQAPRQVRQYISRVGIAIT
jgi:hypothetical protein